MKDLTIKDWLLLEGADEYTTIATVMDLTVEEVKAKEVVDYLACRNYTIQVLDEYKNVQPSREFTFNEVPYIVLETYRDMSVADWVDVETLIRSENGSELTFKLLVLLSRVKGKNMYKQSLTAEEWDMRESDFLQLPAQVLLQTHSFFLQKLKRLEVIGQLYSRIQESQKNKKMMSLLSNQKVLQGYNSNMGSLGFFGKLRNKAQQSLTNLEQWLLMKHLQLSVSLLTKRELLKQLKSRKN